MTYNEIIQKAGKKIKKHVYYINNGVTTNVNDESVERIKFDTQTSLVGTSIDGCEITLKEPINGEIYVQVDATYGNETKSETFGPYNLKEEPTYDANKKTYLHKCYDNLLKSMVDYQPITMTYPCTVYQFFARLCTEIEYTNNILSLPNGSRQIASDIYNNIGFTYRDVLDDIAYANGVLFYIDGNEIKIATLGGDLITIDDDILKNKNIDFGKHYGPINSIVLSRSGESDNVYLQDEESVEQNGLCEFKIIDNQLMRENNRDEFLPALLNQLNGIEYNIYDTELTGYGKLRPLQSVKFETGNNTYNSYIFNNEITITTGYKQAIYNDPPKQTETDYKSADTTDKRINQAYIIVRKNEAEIESLAKKVVEVSDTATGIGSIQLENAYKGQLYQLSIKGNISLLFPQSSAQYGYPLVPRETLVPSNTLTPSSPVPYGNEIHYPNNNLFNKSFILIIDNTEYKLDFDFLNYKSEEVCDEFIYDNGTCYIIRRVGIDSEGNMYALDNEVIEPRKSIGLNVNKNSIIRLKSFNNAILSATYLLDNEYTQNFATNVEVQSQILQSADSITSTVSATYETKGEAQQQYSRIQQTTNSISQTVANNNTKANIIAKINDNTSQVQIDADNIDLTGKNFNLTTNNMSISSTNFGVTNTGIMSCTGANITGGDINMTSNHSNSKLVLTGKSLAGTDSTNRLVADGLRVTSNSKESIKLQLASISSGGTSGTGGVLELYNSIDNRFASMDYDGFMTGTGGNPKAYMYSDGEVHATSYTGGSLESIKKNIELYKENAINIIQNSDIYNYNLKTEDEGDKKHIGLVIADGKNKYRTPKDIISKNGDGIDLYSMISLSWKAIQEQQAIIENLQQRIEALEQRESDK